MASQNHVSTGMLSYLDDLPTLKSADIDRKNSPRGFIRVSRRVLKRCWLDQTNIKLPRVFCQNHGGCGSTYIVKLLETNGIEKTFHEKNPDLLELGLEHYESPKSTPRLVRLLRYTRHNVFFEANNRLFSLSKEIAQAFPNSQMIHLHRDAAESIRSALSKQNLERNLQNNIRFRGSLAGPKTADIFTRCCFHWANMNRRIHQDLESVKEQGTAVFDLRFEDLIEGKVGVLEAILNRELPQKICPPANVRPTRVGGKFPRYSQWTDQQKGTFERICAPVIGLIGR